jgi:predicted amidophosphoribosyltransferase
MASAQARRVGRAAEAVERDLLILKRFTYIFCARHHHPPPGTLCAECGALLDYARGRLSACPYDPKPKCKHCQTHCYQPEMRARIRAIMRYSGMYYVARGRLDWLLQYFLSRG